MTGWITDPADLAAIYGSPVQAVIDKATPRLTRAYADWVAAARFCVLATNGPAGPDLSPRGDDGPVVRQIAPDRLHLPDWHGNNRIDSLKNILHDPKVALMFMVAGSVNVIRVSGTARIGTGAICEGFARDGRLPRAVIEVAITQVMVQCGRALVRAGLWSGAAAPEGLPSPGAMMAEITQGALDGAAYDRDWPSRAAATMW